MKKINISYWNYNRDEEDKYYITRSLAGFYYLVYNWLGDIYYSGGKICPFSPRTYVYTIYNLERYLEEYSETLVFEGTYEEVSNYLDKVMLLEL